MVNGICAFSRRSLLTFDFSTFLCLTRVTEGHILRRNLRGAEPFERAIVINFFLKGLSGLNALRCYLHVPSQSLTFVWDFLH